jgi:ABC-type lipoprotein export system ATPase subunit
MIQANEVTFGYGRAEPVIRDLSVTFSAGELVAVTGPSGRGKSTLLYLLGLMLRPRSGQILIDGRESSRLGDAERAEIRAGVFGFVFQDAALDPTRTVLDNVVEGALYRREHRASAVARATGLLERMQVSLRSSALPGQVSGGQAQRIALCRALLNNPRILLADEPTGNLDGDSAGLVLSAFREHSASGAAVVVVTHDLALAAECDRVVRL